MILRVLRSSAAQRLIGNVRPISRSSAAQRVIGNVRPFSIFVRQHQVIGNANNQPISRNFSSTDAVSKGCFDVFGFDNDLIANIAASMGPSVVRIHVPMGFLGFTEDGSNGSGIIIDNQFIITNCHVVMNCKKPILKSKESERTGVKVTFYDGKTLDGRVTKYDVNMDIAIVRVDDIHPYPPVKLGTSRNLRPGHWVMSFGSPLSLYRTVSVGIINCIDRASDDIGCRGKSNLLYIQSDSISNEGSSGGPVVNLDGEVIGIFFRSYGRTYPGGQYLPEAGFSFAIPIDPVMKFISRFFSRRGKVMKASDGDHAGEE